MAEQEPPVEELFIDNTTNRNNVVTVDQDKWVKKSQEFSRIFLAVAFSLIYLLVMIVSVGAYLAAHQTATVDKAVLQDIGTFIAPVATLVASIVGFYFGSKTKSE